MPVLPQKYKPRAEWLLTMEQRENALARRHAKQGAVLSEHTKQLEPLKVSDIVMVQNQRGHHAKKWDKSGTVVEIMGHDQYRIRMDGSGRTTLRNRRFLRPFTPFTKTHRIIPSNTLTTGLSRTQPSTPVTKPVSTESHFSRDHTLPTEQAEHVGPKRQEEHEVPGQVEEEAAQAEDHVVLGEVGAAAEPQHEQVHHDVARRSSRPRQPNKKLADYILNPLLMTG
jgi:hypothetical protein